MCKKCIGIVSYLPDVAKIRQNRINKLLKLISKCNILFNLPILIIAQNWKDFNIWDSHVSIIPFEDKLGIVGARKALRKVFLDSDYDYLIMLDDDCTLCGISGSTYLKQIDDNPDCFIEFNKTLLKLFAISKTLFKLVDYDDVKPEDGGGFEDRIFVNRLRKYYPEKRRLFTNTGLEQHSIATDDPDSTWYTNQNLSKMLENTFNIIDNL